MVPLLGAIGDALPDSTAIVSLRVDSASGSMTVVSSAAARVLPALEELSGIAGAALAGSVSRENMGGARVQRVAIRFRRPPVDTATTRAGGQPR